MKYGSGFSYAPSVSQTTILTSKESTIQIAKEEIIKHLESEHTAIQKGEKLHHQHRLKQAIKELSSPPKPEQLDLL